MKKTFLTLFLFLLLVLSLSACTYFHQGKISQDKLPWVHSGQVLMEEDFSKPSTNWEEVNNVYELKRYSDEGYFMSINPADGRSVSSTGKVFSDAKFSVQAQKVTGPINTNYGLVCRYVDKQNFYAFVVSTDGYAGIYRVKDGKTSMLSGDKFIYSDVIAQNDGVNTIFAECNGDMLSLGVNGSDLLTIKDEQFTIGELGLFLETSEDGSASAVFNDFIVVKP